MEEKPDRKEDNGMVLKERDLKKIGIQEYGMISTAQIPFEQEIRKICKENVCRLYGKTWACPPVVGTVDAYRAQFLSYQTAMVFHAVYPLEDSFDYEGMTQGHGAFKDLRIITDESVFTMDTPEEAFHSRKY